jgi:hypothetical protein
MTIFHYKGIQIHLRKDQCIRLKYILVYSDEFYEFENLDEKLNEAIQQKEIVEINLHEFRWIKRNIHLSRI